MASCYRSLAILKAMGGSFDEARRLFGTGQSITEQLGLKVISAGTISMRGTIELLAGDVDRAEGILRTGLKELQEFGTTIHHQEAAITLARTLYSQAKYAEAWEMTERAGLGGSHDIAVPVWWHSIRGKLLAQRGEGRKATRLARRAVELSAETDLIDLRGDALMDLAEVLSLTEKRTDARQALQSALDLYEKKKNLVSAHVARAALGI